MSTTHISVAEQFSPTPAGRYLRDGPYPGERFRDEWLIPALRREPRSVVEIDLDGTAGFGSSFLEEAFGGLVRAGFPPDQLRLRLRIRSSRPSYIERVWSYIDRAAH